MEIVEFIPVRCPKCGAVMGRMIPRETRIILATEAWEIVEGTRPCPDCRKPFSFRPPKLTWEALVERWLKVNGKALEACFPESV